jgi:transcriptional regulator with XRE-family HTH domain
LATALIFLEMSAEERQLLDARVEVALAIRRQREARKLSQKELGSRLKMSQPRIAKIERAASDVSLDQLVQAFPAAGGKMVVKSVTSNSRKGKRTKGGTKETLIDGSFAVAKDSGFRRAVRSRTASLVMGLSYVPTGELAIPIGIYLDSTMDFA